MFKAQTTRKSGAIAPKSSLPKNVSQDSDLSDSSSEDEPFQGIQAPPMTQKQKAAEPSSDSDSSDLDHSSPARGSKLTGKPQLPGISPILAKLSVKDTSTPLRGSKATPTKNPPRPTQRMGSSDSDSDSSEADVPTTQGRSSDSANTNVAQKRESGESDSEYDAPWSPSKQKPALSKVNGKKVTDSDLDSDSNDQEENTSVRVKSKLQSPKKLASDSELETEDEEEDESPVPTKPQSPTKAKVSKASDSDSELDSEDEEADKSPVPSKPQSPTKASVPNASDSDSDLDSEESPTLAAQPKLQSPKKASVPNASDSDSDLDSDKEPENLPTVQRKLQFTKKATALRKSSESELESSSDDDDTKLPFMTSKPKPASPAKATATATAMEVDESSDDEAMIREAMNQVNQAEERAKAGAILRKSASAADSETDSDFQPKSAKDKKASKGTPKQPEPKDVVSFLSKATISESDEVSSDSEPEKLGPIRLNTSLTPANKSITALAQKGMEEDPAESSASDGEEEEAGPIADNSPGLLYLEDVASNDEVWLVRCPVDAKPSDLIGRKLVLGGISKFMLGDDEFEARTYKHADALSRLTCLLRSKDVDGLLKVVSVPSAGQVTFTRKVKLPPISLPATTSSEGKTTALPVGLKTRHPLFGADFQQAITVRDKTEDRPQTTKAAAESPKKDSKRRSVTFREKPSFESTQQSNQESSSEEDEEAEESMEESDEADHESFPKDMIAVMLNKALRQRQTTSLKLEKSETSVKPAKSSKRAATTSIGRHNKNSNNTLTSPRKSLQLKESLTTKIIEKHLEEISSPVNKAGLKKSKKTLDSPTESLNSKTRQKSLVSTPISNHQKLTSTLDNSDSSVLVPKKSKAKVSEKKVNTKAEISSPMPELLETLLGASESSVATQNTSHKKGSKKRSKSNIETPLEAKKDSSLLDNSDSSVSKRKSSLKKGSKKMDISVIETPSEAKKDSSLLDNSDSSVSKGKSSHKKGSKKMDISVIETPSEAKKDSSLLDNSDSSVSKRKSSHKKGSKKMDISVIETPSEVKKDSSLLDNSDSSVSKRKSSHKKGSKKMDISVIETPSEAKKDSSLLDNSDSSVSKRKSSLKKGSKKMDISVIETPSEVKKDSSLLDNSDSSVSKKKSSLKKGSKKMDISVIETPSEAKKDSSLLDNSDSSVSKGKSSLIKMKGSKAEISSKTKKTAILNSSDSLVTKPITSHGNSHDETRSSNTKTKSRKSDLSLSSSLLANYLSRSLTPKTKNLIENTTTDQDSHTESLASKSTAENLKTAASVLDGSDTSTPKSKVSKKKDDSMSDSSATKAKRKSRKSETSTVTNCLNSSTNESPLNTSKISSEKNRKTNTLVKETNKMEAKIDTLPSSSQPNVSADGSTLSSKLNAPKVNKEEKSKKRLRKSAAENIVDKSADLEQEDLVAMLLQQAMSSEKASAKEEDERLLPKSKSLKSSEADTAVKKERVAIKAKRRIGKTNSKDDQVKQSTSQVTTKKKESMALKGDSSTYVAKSVLEETAQQKLIAELMRRSIEGIEGKGSKKRRREDGEEGGTAVKKSKKSRLADDKPDTPTSSKTSSKGKPPVKKYRQLTLTSTIPPGIAELSPVSATAKSKTGSDMLLKVNNLESPATTKEPAETKTPPSKEKKKRKRDSSVSDLDIDSKKHKPIIQSEMGSQDASFTSKFQSAGYAGPGSPLFQRPSPSLGASQSDIDVQFESQDSIGLVANLETNQFEIPVTKKVRKSSASRDKRKLDASIDFGDFGCGGNLVSSTQKQSASVLPSNPSSQGSEDSLDKVERPRKAEPSDANYESPFVFKAPILSKGGRKKSSSRGDESGFESDGSASRKRGEVDGFESDVTLKLFRTQPDPIALAKHRAKKHLKNAR